MATLIFIQTLIAIAFLILILITIGFFLATLYYWFTIIRMVKQTFRNIEEMAERFKDDVYERATVTKRILKSIPFLGAFFEGLKTPERRKSSGDKKTA